MKHSIRAYRGLCREVSILSEATLVPESSNAANGELLKERRGAILNVLSIAQP